MTEETESAMAMTEQEVEVESAKIAAYYLENRGYEILDASSTSHIVARDRDEYVIVGIRGEAGECDEMPTLDLDHEDVELLRKSCLFYAAGHPEVNAVRADVIAIAIVGDHKACLRHLIAATRWTEDE